MCGYGPPWSPVPPILQRYFCSGIDSGNFGTLLIRLSPCLQHSSNIFRIAKRHFACNDVLFLDKCSIDKFSDPGDKKNDKKRTSINILPINIID